MQAFVIIAIAGITMFAIVHTAYFCGDYGSKKHLDMQKYKNFFKEIHESPV